MTRLLRGRRAPLTLTVLCSIVLGSIVLCSIVLGLAVLGGPAALRSMSASLSQLGLGSLAYGYEYSVELEHAAGLTSGSQVRIAGIRKGVVRSVELHGRTVLAQIVLDSDFPLGQETTATVRMASLLGQQYVALQPAGPGRMDHGDTIPLDRTQVPYTLNEFATDTTRTLGRIDTERLDTLLRTLGDTFEATPRSNRLALREVMRLTESTAARGDDIALLLERTAQATAMLDEERQAIFGLMADADEVLRTVHERREMLHGLLVDTRAMARQINRLVARSEDRFAPAMVKLERVLATLTSNQKALETLMKRQAVTAKYFTNVQGTGPYVNVFVPYSLIPDHALCVLGLLGEECR